MLQRIQSVFLGLVTVACLLSMVFPYKVYSSVSPELQIIEMTNLPLFKSEGVKAIAYVPAILNALILILSIWTIFSFKNRLFQLKLIRVMLLFLIGLINLIIFVDFYDADMHARIFRWALSLPFLSLVFSILAYRAIKKDEELVRSADRIR